VGPYSEHDFLGEENAVALSLKLLKSILQQLMLDTGSGFRNAVSKDTKVKLDASASLPGAS
jgi:hypothetical protein